MLRAMRLLLRIARTGPLAAIVERSEELSILDHKLDESTDEELIHIIRARSETLYHPTSTARMAPLEEGKRAVGRTRVYLYCC
jgi:choline dehydrogenase